MGRTAPVQHADDMTISTGRSHQLVIAERSPAGRPRSAVLRAHLVRARARRARAAAVRAAVLRCAVPADRPWPAG
jgi:hypothetical protein